MRDPPLPPRANHSPDCLLRREGAPRAPGDRTRSCANREARSVQGSGRFPALLRRSMHPGPDLKRQVFALALATSFLVLGLSLTAAPNRASVTAMPSWSVGDYWLYSFNSTGLLAPWTVRASVIDTEVADAGGMAYSSFLVRTTPVTGPVPGASYVREEWFRVTDLALVMEKESVNNPSAGFQQTTIQTFAPPPPLHWPLITGSTWSGSTTVTTAITYASGSPSTSNTTEAFTFTVLTNERIEVPAGAFLAAPLVENETVNGTQFDSSWTYWSPVVNGTVLQQTTNSIMKLLSYGHGGSSGTDFNWSLGLIPAGAGVLAIAYFFRRRRKSRPKEGANPPGGP